MTFLLYNLLAFHLLQVLFDLPYDVQSLYALLSVKHRRRRQYAFSGYNLHNGHLSSQCV